MSDTAMVHLDQAECRRLLETASLGRVGICIGALPAIFPIRYRVAQDQIVFRTVVGTKLSAATDRAVVAFEVDSAEPRSGEAWSVLVVGKAVHLDADVRFGPEPETPSHAGLRPHLVGVAMEVVTGRRSRPDTWWADQPAPAASPTDAEDFDAVGLAPEQELILRAVMARESSRYLRERIEAGRGRDPDGRLRRLQRMYEAAARGELEPVVAEVEALQDALATRTVLAHAVGLVMAGNQLSRDAATDHLIQASERTNRSLEEVAAEIVAAHERQIGG